jgi:hypothetical protein
MTRIEKQTLLQKQFLVSTGNRSLVLTSVKDTIYVIQKMTRFWYRLLLSDTKDAFLFVSAVIMD